MWIHRARRMRHGMPTLEECGHTYRMSIMGQTLSQAFCINYLWSSLCSYVVGIISVVAWDGREGHWWDKWETISLRSRNYCYRIRRSGDNNDIPRMVNWISTTRLYGMWFLGFRGRGLLAGAGIQADFVSLANWILVHSVSPLIGPGSKEVCRVYMIETMQNKAHSSAVLLIQINDPHLQM